MVDSDRQLEEEEPDTDDDEWLLVPPLSESPRACAGAVSEPVVAGAVSPVDALVPVAGAGVVPDESLAKRACVEDPPSAEPAELGADADDGEL